ncbi:MAG: GPI anchored serine-threonine rich family protein [Ignavibacteriaceae bacterium]|jgi:hypothetical protein|nr:GPI anchored serine-threonine rich family protein [Ignavibacteriaceae bacterium]MCW9065601.1 GPI anchored serine-threonine rich family protein [Ignavibacteriaceae bacterium]
MSYKKLFLGLLTISVLLIVSCSKDEPTNPSQSPSPSDKITVVSPNGGESWLAGTSYTIAWTSTINDDVKIELYKGGSILYTIANSTSNSGNYLWAIPDTLHSAIDCKIKITSVLDNSITDYSDSGFVALGLVLSNDYSGFLQLRFTNQYPAFDETTQVDVAINKYGEVTFGTGTLSYSGDDNNGQSRIVRNGTLQLNPTGYYFDNSGEDYIGVDENTTVNENMIVYYWDGTQWKEALNENITDTWHGGLAFSIVDAVISGSIIQVVTAQGSVIWGLYLVVIP